MQPRPVPYTIAASAMAASAGLHLLATAFAGFAPSTLFMLGIAAYYLLLAFGLLRALRWVAYLTFVCVLIGANGALVELGLGRFSDVSMVAIALADAVAAVALIAALWRSRDAATNAR